MKILSQSNLYQGVIKHRRYSQKKHQFQYKLYMLLLDIRDVQQPFSIWPLGSSWFHPMRFVAKDYVKGEPQNLALRINNKFAELGGIAPHSVKALVQVRCFGLYFSPANFYFGYSEEGHCFQVLAEVSNTPWNERHYYLIKLDEQGLLTNEKQFHVSPFMNLDMNYFWQFKTPSEARNNLLIHIENRAKETNEKLFDASLIMRKKPLNKTTVYKLWLAMPLMTFKVVLGIYYQALKLIIKRVRFIPYQKYQG
ncbi:DUF1365 domain-containing protein [Parashewanella hymeniacidonis]|uniref:DUF1365 domain-containing protein n=1 Tax=Parashewanella hymeniacidonis TaxID=2807618 RepID=UPI001EF5AD9C|nr:DUF1365 domain-containing protein [Parashewanella hymeniacidonis]